MLVLIKISEPLFTQIQMIVLVFLAIISEFNCNLDLEHYSYDQYRIDFSKEIIVNQQEYFQRKLLFEQRLKEIIENNRDGMDLNR